MFFNHLAATGQERDPPELIMARDMALNTTGLFAECTPTMAWNRHFGDKEAYDAELYRRGLARHPFAKPPTVSRPSAVSNPLSQRLKRATAMRASAAWADLSPRKRQRRH